MSLSSRQIRYTTVDLSYRPTLDRGNIHRTKFHSPCVYFHILLYRESLLSIPSHSIPFMLRPYTIPLPSKTFNSILSHSPLFSPRYFKAGLSESTSRTGLQRQPSENIFCFPAHPNWAERRRYTNKKQENHSTYREREKRREKAGRTGSRMLCEKKKGESHPRSEAKWYLPKRSRDMGSNWKNK